MLSVDPSDRPGAIEIINDEWITATLNTLFNHAGLGMASPDKAQALPLVNTNIPALWIHQLVSVHFFLLIASLWYVPPLILAQCIYQCLSECLALISLSFFCSVVLFFFSRIYILSNRLSNPSYPSALSFSVTGFPVSRRPKTLWSLLMAHRSSNGH